jgi:hypothetical protein
MGSVYSFWNVIAYVRFSAFGHYGALDELMYHHIISQDRD